MKNRNFIVNITLKMSGEFPSDVDEEFLAQEIAENIHCESHFAYGEHGDYEYFIGTTSKEEEIDVNVKEYLVSYNDNPYCEHCGQNHSDFAATINLDGTNWCATCAEGAGYFNEEELEEICKKEKKGLKNHYKNKLKELEDE